MSINLETFTWPMTFNCSLVIEQLIFPNSYEIKISIEPITQSQGNIANGFKKIRYFIENYLHHSIFINQNNSLLNSIESINTNIVKFPVEPYDYFVSSIIYKKLSSISKKYFNINQITVDSVIGDKIQYTIRDPEECGLDLSGMYWWNEDNTNTGLGNPKLWNDLNIDVNETKFEPRIIKGGLSEH